MDLKIIYTTLPDKLIASNIAKILIEEKLAACVNIIGSIESFYIWEGKLTQNDEVLLLAKTLKEKEVMLRIRQLHPYEIPCVLSIDISNCESKFLSWVRLSI